MQTGSCFKQLEIGVIMMEATTIVAYHNAREDSLPSHNTLPLELGLTKVGVAGGPGSLLVVTFIGIRGYGSECGATDGRAHLASKSCGRTRMGLLRQVDMQTGCNGLAG